MQPDERLERVRLLRERGLTPKQIARALGIRSAEADRVGGGAVFGSLHPAASASDTMARRLAYFMTSSSRVPAGSDAARKRAG